MDLETLVVCIFLFSGVLCEDHVKVIRTISLRFGQTVLECQKKMHFGDDIINQLLNFWKNQPLVDKVIGCAVLCAATQLQLLKPDGSLHEPHTQGFIIANGADNFTVKKVIELYKTCQQKFMLTDTCMLTLEMIKCLRDEIKQLNWTPNLEDDMNYAYSDNDD